MTHRKFQFLTLVMLMALSFLTIGAQAQTETSDLASGGYFSVRGSYAVGTQDFQIEAETPLEITAWYPAVKSEGAEELVTYNYEIKMDMPPEMVATVTGQAIQQAEFDLSDGPYPLIILSPGFSIGRTSYAWLAEHLASYGFVVIAPEHQEHADETLSGFWPAAITRPQEIHTVLAYLDEQSNTNGSMEGLVNTDVIAVIGHSYGGYTSLMMAGARYDISSMEELCASAAEAGDPNAWLCDLILPNVADMAALAGLEDVPDELWPSQADDRVDAIVSMAGDAYFFGETGLAEITVPVMAIGGTADTGTPYAWGTEPTYDYVGSSSKARVTFEDAEHMIFAATCDELPWFAEIGFESFCSDPEWDVDQAHDLISHFVTAFLLTELKQDAEAAAALAPDAVNFSGVAYDAQGY